MLSFHGLGCFNLADGDHTQLFERPDVISIFQFFQRRCLISILLFNFFCWNRLLWNRELCCMRRFLSSFHLIIAERAGLSCVRYNAKGFCMFYLFVFLVFVFIFISFFVPFGRVDVCFRSVGFWHLELIWDANWPVFGMIHFRFELLYKSYKILRNSKLYWV